MDITADAVAILTCTLLMCAMLCGFIALSKERSWLGFALIGLLLGPIGLIITGEAEPGHTVQRIADDDRAGPVEPARLDRDQA